MKWTTWNERDEMKKWDDVKCNEMNKMKEIKNIKMEMMLTTRTSNENQLKKEAQQEDSPRAQTKQDNKY